MVRHHRWIAYFSVMILFFLFSCGRTKTEDADHAIWAAQLKLQDKDCAAAWAALGDLHRPYDAVFLQTKAAVYACLAGLDIPTFFEKEIPKLSNMTGFNGTTLFSSSYMTDSEDDAFRNLQDAIATLLYAGNLPHEENPTPAQRAAIFSSYQLGDMHGMLIYLLLANLGKYFAYYGNTDVSGTKGLGDGSNTCLFNYDTSISVEGDWSSLSPALPTTITLGQFLSAGITGSCTGTNGLDLTTTQMCQGVTLVNNFLEIFTAVVASLGTDDWDKIKVIKEAINRVRGLITTPDMAAVENMLSQEKCEAAFAEDNTALQVYFAVYLETLLQ